MKKENKNICSVCGKPYEFALTVSIVNGKQVCEHDNPSFNKKRKQRHVNEEASIIAMRQATEMRVRDRDMGEDRMVSVVSTQEGRNKGKVEMIPEKVIKKIDEKIEPLLEE